MSNNKKSIEEHIRETKDLSISKPLIVSLPKSTHTAFRIIAFKKRISMSDIVREFVEKVVMGDQKMIGILNNIKRRKETKSIKELTNNEVESIYELLETLRNREDDT